MNFWREVALLLFMFFSSFAQYVKNIIEQTLLTPYYSVPPKNTKNAFFACFWAYFWHPHNHVGLATPMPFASINPNNPRTNPRKFWKKYWELAEMENDPFLSRPFWIFFFQKKKNFFASLPWKLVNIYRLARMCRNFDDYPGFQPKIAFAI